MAKNSSSDTSAASAAVALASLANVPNQTSPAPAPAPAPGPMPGPVPALAPVAVPASIPVPPVAAPPAPAPTTTTPAPPNNTPDWTMRTELHNTEAHFYRGPLPPARVLELLASPETSKNARSALTGTPGGYLKYLHFLGPSTTPVSRRRPGKTKTLASNTGAENTSSGSGSTDPSPAPRREWWQCRACHTDLHTPPDQISNLGSHLYGTAKPLRPGCLDLRADHPAEAIPPPLRDAEGKIVRIRPDKPVPATRAVRQEKDP
ncbi:unnamed protein product [Tilletia controversa]|nr:unnamed protein product [Tilletia controversa]